MYKYINFNNLRKKKGFAGGDVVVGWSSYFWKYKKQLRKKKTKNNLLFEQKKNIENIFLLFSKKWFLRIRKTQKKQKHSLFPKQVFCVFYF